MCKAMLPDDEPDRRFPMTIPLKPHSLPQQARSSAFRIVGGSVLHRGALVETEVGFEDGKIAAIGASGGGRRELDASGLFVLPGIIDIHGDAFERLVTPRPAVSFDPMIGLIEADRQYAANGITTGYHAITWSWEGGQRDGKAAMAVLNAIERLRPALSVDTRCHLRHETFNLDAESTIIDWIGAGRIDCLAFNDHMGGTIKQRHRPDKLRQMLERACLDEAAFQALIDATFARAEEVPASIARLADGARGAGLPMLSHDDLSPKMRQSYRDMGCAIAEFPVNEATAEAAAASGDPIVFGAPNVVRGGSHTGCPSAAEMAERGLCTVLASDYYYPALPLAPFRLAAATSLDLAAAWALVSAGPAKALGLADRGEISAGLRADIVLLEDRSPLPPRVVATIVAGRIVHLTEPERL
jgi:alpha-D-ribose 1-methylphosphonate 5-triphosphate diphosphatase